MFLSQFVGVGTDGSKSLAGPSSGEPRGGSQRKRAEEGALL